MERFVNSDFMAKMSSITIISLMLFLVSNTAHAQIQPNQTDQRTEQKQKVEQERGLTANQRKQAKQERKKIFRERKQQRALGLNQRKQQRKQVELQKKEIFQQRRQQKTSGLNQRKHQRQLIRSQRKNIKQQRKQTEIQRQKMAKKIKNTSDKSNN